VVLPIILLIASCILSMLVTTAANEAIAAPITAQLFAILAPIELLAALSVTPLLQLVIYLLLYFTFTFWNRSTKLAELAIAAPVAI
jgi:hypothetical protein